MAVNKVVYGNRTLIDLTDSTVTPETLAESVTAYNAQGVKIIGTAKTMSGGLVDFSTEEVDTGIKWIDGKKIYAKTLVQLDAAGNNTVHSIDLPDGVELAWLDAANSFHINSGVSYAPGAYVASKFCFIILVTTTEVSFATQLTIAGDFYIRVFYTKTSINALDTDKLDAFTLA